MEKKNFEIDYDKERDIMSIHSRGAKSKFSFDISLPKGDFVIDFGYDGKIVGIEFFNASAYFPGLEKVNISKLNVALAVRYSNDWAEIGLEISSPELEKPFSRMIISPYNKEFVVKN
ncbi:MAG: DUF2283 domain-containing protein [Candidatus Pacearchaeota archaeon]|nr:DUF2283 domain-containing protein [Candidatus Pacearchaeota archaeon]